MRTKYLFFDYDGTLSDKMLPVKPEVLAALESARKAGHKLFICSGRCRYMFPDDCGFRFDGYILACGADISVGNTKIFDRTLPYDTLEPVVRLATARGATFIYEGENIAVRIPGGEEKWPCPTATDYDDFAARFGNMAIINKFSIMEPCSDEISAVADKLGFRTIDHLKSGEYVPKGFSKSGGMKMLIKDLSIPFEDTVAFGDSMNDTDMIEYAATGVAMGNALDSLKAKADYVTGDVKSEGVAEYIYNVLLK